MNISSLCDHGWLILELEVMEAEQLVILLPVDKRQETTSELTEAEGG